MTPTQTVKQYGENVVTVAKPAVLACIGAGDLAVERAKAVFGQFVSKSQALPGEAQVQADLAVKEARTRATEAAGNARTTAHQLAVATRRRRCAAPSPAWSNRPHPGRRHRRVPGRRGAEVVEELRHQPGFRRVVRRAERAVDTVEDALEDVLEETAEAVVEASNEVTSVAQKTAAKATKVKALAEDKVEDVLGSREATAKKAVEAPGSGAKPVSAKSTTVKAAPGQEDHRRPQGPGQVDLGPRDPRPHRQAGQPDRGARQEELTSPDVGPRPGPRSCDQRSGALSRPGPAAPPRRGRRPRSCRDDRPPAGRLAHGDVRRAADARALRGRPGADAVGLRRCADPAGARVRGHGQADQARLGGDHRSRGADHLPGRTR